ncbi:bifunctional DNA primase/polymerase [Seohaeicola nanhaiensis]|uniref:Bifunctional DNA primase/polymerase n=1 Tax=Seohaeicola nanhaiensis TaxID=1387282 RepID=A0ABV9KNF9_9RHOB
MNAARIFAAHAHEYAEAGLPAFPVDARHKRPAVKGWQFATPQRARIWAADARLGDADGLGIVMGQASGLTEIDVDGVGEAWLAVVLERFGGTPLTVRTASGKSKAWYRHNGEGRRIRPFPGQPIDVLGAGFSIAPPSWREDLGASYAFRTGGLAALDGLPVIKPGALDTGFSRAAEGVQQGERNHALWRYCMTQARHCDDLDALSDVAATWASAFPDPLSASEVQRCARSAWGYETTGRNFLGLIKPQVTEGDRRMDALIDNPDAFTLLMLFQRWHGSRPSFRIAPTAMSEAKQPPWHHTRIARARDTLIERGFVEEIKPPVRGKRPGLYRLA